MLHGDCPALTRSHEPKPCLVMAVIVDAFPVPLKVRPVTNAFA